MALASKRLLFTALAMLPAAGCRRSVPPASAPTASRLDAAVAGATTPAPPPAPRGKQLTLFYSSDLLAAYEVCGCPVHPMGGVARRATQIDRARAEADAVLVVDAGNLFLPSRAEAAGRPVPDPGEVERRGQLLAAAFGRMGTTALAPGERDLALGLPLLLRLAKQARLPIVSANLRGPDGKLLFDADRLVDAAGVKVGIFSVTVPPSMQEAAAWRAAGIDASDAAAEARSEVASLRARGAELVIALLQVGGGPDNRRLLEAVPGIDWAVTGGSGLRLEDPERVASEPVGLGPMGSRPAGARMLGAMADGKELGRLDLHVVGGSVAFVDRGERAEIETIVADHRRQLVDYDRRLGETDPASLRVYYETRRHELEKAITREDAVLERLPRTITGSWFENRLLPLDAATPDQNGVAILVDAYNRESVRRAARGKPVGVGTEHPPAPATTPAGKGEPTYVGTAACAACHAPALAFWKTTKHAHALAALARIGRDRDPSCVGCHVTGYLQSGGWRVDAASPRLPAGARGDAEAPCKAGVDCRARGAGRSPLDNVGCEACHGPGRAHVEAADKKASGGGQVSAAVCLGCHTADVTGGDFDPRRFREAILGPGHGKVAAALAPAPGPPL